MTEIKTIEGGQKRCPPLESQHKKNLSVAAQKREKKRTNHDYEEFYIFTCESIKSLRKTKFFPQNMFNL